MTVRPRLHLSRSSKQTELVHGFHDPAHYMIWTVGLAMAAQVVEASAARPYVGFRLAPDPSVVASVILESGVAPSRGDAGAQAGEPPMRDVQRLRAS
jgi:hypothetical protein